MKKIMVIVCSIVFLGIYLNLGKIQALFDTKVMGVEVLPMEEIEALCEGKEDAYIWPEITLNGNSAAYDMEQNMFLIPQDLSESSFEGKLEVPDGKLYFAEDEALNANAVDGKAAAIAENRVFRLFWIRESQCWMYNVYFSGMPVMNITSETDEDEQGVTYGNVQVYDQYHSSAAYQSTQCNWHLRGATTLTYEKKSYRLTLTDEKLSFLGMREDDDWILHALYDDEGLIHNKLSYEVWQKIAADNQVSNDEGIRMEYVEVFLDYEYIGVYGLSERIDKKTLNLNDKDILYKCRDQKDPGEDDFYSELTEEMNPTFEWKWPNDFTMEDWEPIRLWSNRHCLNEPFDYEDGKALLNMENAIDYNLFNLLTCGMDNIMKNVYFWADYQSDGSYRMIKIPWDLNMTWGNSWIDDYDCNFNKYQEKNLDAPDGWTPDMYDLYEQNPEEIGELLNDRWQELRESIITKEALYEEVDTQLDYLYSSGAYIRNRQKWPPKGEYWSDSYLYEYIDKRIDFLDSYISQLSTGE